MDCELLRLRSTSRFGSATGGRRPAIEARRFRPARPRSTPTSPTTSARGAPGVSSTSRAPLSLCAVDIQMPIDGRAHCNEEARATAELRAHDVTVNAGVEARWSGQHWTTHAPLRPRADRPRRSGRRRRREASPDDRIWKRAIAVVLGDDDTGVECPDRAGRSMPRPRKAPPDSD